MASFFNQIDFKKFFNLSYIFESQPPAQSIYLYLGILFGLMIVAAIGVLYFYKPQEIYENFKNQIKNLLLITGILGLVLIFFRWQQISYLGSRFVLSLLFLFFIFYLTFILYSLFFIVPKEKKKEQEEDNFQKYLPHKRKK